MSNSQKQDENCTLKKFLIFLDEDMNKNPQNIKPITSEMLNRVKYLTEGIEVDLDAPLSGEDE